MRTFGDESEEFRMLSLRCKGLAGSLLSGLPPERAAVKVAPDHNVTAEKQFEKKVLLLKEGYLTYRRHHRRIMYFEPGDLVGFEQEFTHKRLDISSSMPVLVDVYDAETLFKHIGQNAELVDAWSEYLVTFSSACLEGWAMSSTERPYFLPAEHDHRAGDVIIEEGTSAETVFLLDSGHAEVTVKGRKVGEVKAGELFGLLAGLTGANRTATVRTTEASRVFQMKRDQFVELTKARPQTVVRMVQSMARVISSLNEQLVEPAVSKEENLRGG